jgi:hypothetical protein
MAARKQQKHFEIESAHYRIPPAFGGTPDKTIFGWKLALMPH